ncbi:General secretion pathway protein K [Candidatus Rhodobacter oscarellae]|uniref:Type II secretion system protein K n=1 Tax=Candidatus Rhodobacter oscarellae TaxID=1675527 RepID=A0A0J9E9H7_9RHOB|nr:type II secretion system protein GspK [Candidatus Rhodobacter lobularis]KMW59440.1 General secretion pathway protein K [Candidatus Rhodobacter lobularis]
MTRDRGAVLINALVVVLAIAAVAAAMLTRSESARIRGAGASQAAQLSLYLDGAERLLPALLADVTDNPIAHSGQSWAKGPHRFPIDRGRVAISLVDLQGRLNVNWLTRDDDYARDVFRATFTELGLRPALVNALAIFVAQRGPAMTVDDLRAVPGIATGEFAAMRSSLSALPVDTRLNLNTASDAVKRAAIAPLPPELITEIMQRQTPIQSTSELRKRAEELLGTEELDHLPFDTRLTVGSMWFRADIRADLGDLHLRRALIIQIDTTAETPTRRVLRWAVYD